MRDWEAGRNLVEAAAVVYGTKSKKALAALIKLRDEELASKRKKGTQLNVSGLGKLTHDGVRFVCRKKTLLYPKSSVIVEVPLELANSESIGLVWTRFCLRERSLLRELESALARYYRKIRLRPGLTGVDPLPSLRRNADIWKTLGKPEIAFTRRRDEIAISFSWSPEWEEEHGLYAALSPDARIVSVGEYGEQ
ncbi:MAG: hypothetical protein C0485_15680 [Pirellula sp.]|nr:hypothetical protein [Pirellula sp.]